MQTPQPARIHLLPAKAAPYVVVIRRKPTNWVHVLRWNTLTDQVEYGTWFYGHLYAKRSDISFDGNWMVYLARDAKANTCNCVCHPPLLEPIINVPSNGTWYGGGYWESKDTLNLNAWHWPLLRNLWAKAKQLLPFQLKEFSTEIEAELGVLYRRLRRDGWTRCGENYGQETKLEGNEYLVECIGDDGWQYQPSSDHPILRAQHIGYLRHGHTFKFWLEGYPEIIDQEVDWACWDALGQLIFSRNGVLYKYALKGITTRTPTTVLDLEHLLPPKT